MTINETIKRLKELKPDTKLRFFDEFGHMLSSDFIAGSWRGSYDLPAIELDFVSNWEGCTTAEKAITELSEADGRHVTGYKGGEFHLKASDELFLVADSSSCGDSTIIVEILSDGYIKTNKDINGNVVLTGDKFIELKQKADKYDKFDKFAVAIDELIKGDIDSIEDDLLKMEMDYVNKSDKKKCFKFFHKMTNQGFVTDLDSFKSIKKEIEKEDYYFEFDYNLLETFFDKRYDIKYYGFYSLELISSGNYTDYSLFTDFLCDKEIKPNKVKWAIWERNKQLTKQEVNNILNS